ncbi:MAG: adenylyl-sulfate kinase [Proteobacteria bacterium]|nr:adenylyl-sulfate kinase [Pseudomonadota bacterium]
MSEPKSTHIRWHGANVDRNEREALLGQRGCVVWFTGLSGSGKSTVSRRVEQLLLERKVVTYGLDGDNLRFGLNKDLGFSAEDRSENIRRVGCVAQLFMDSGTVTLTAFISPYQRDRDAARALVGAERFVEVFVDTPLEVCESRDPKGLYKKARSGEIANFTGISAPYEAPTAPEVHLLTDGKTVDASAQEVVDYLETRGFLEA